jgi:hypothetical protein
MKQFTFDVRGSGICDHSHLPAGHAISFAFFEPGFRAGLLLIFDPGGELLPIDPEMAGLVPILWYAGLQPITQRAVGDTQFIT